MNRDMKKTAPAMFHPSQNQSTGGLHSKIAQPSVRSMDFRSNPSNVMGYQAPAPLRLADGGDVTEAKKEQGQSVGFFERLRMGNIDDPNSEAYKRFGAGAKKADAELDAAIKEADNLRASASAPAAAPAPASAAKADSMEGALPPAMETAPAAPKPAAKPAAKPKAAAAPVAPAKPKASAPAPSRRAKARSSDMTLSQRLGKEFADLQAQADRAAKDERTTPQSRRMIARMAEDKRKAYEAAAESEKTGKSVVRVR